MVEPGVFTGWMEPRLPEYLDRLRALVNLDCGTDNKTGVDEVGRIFREYLRASGATLEEFSLSQYGDCCLATWRGRGKLRLLISGHLDTVYPQGTVAERPMKIEGNQALGPGVSDMKAGLLTGLYAVSALKAVGFDDYQEIKFFLNTDEEVDSPESKKIYQPLAARVDAALVLESARANGDIVSSRKGNATYRVTVRGRQAHAGVEMEKGANAIVELARIIHDLTSLNQMHPGTTLNVGSIGGGTRSNVVPDYAWAEVDSRFLTFESGKALDRAVKEVAKSASVPGTQIELSGGITKGPMEKTTATGFLVELAKRVGAQLGIHFDDVQTGGTSDGNFIGELGIPTLDGLAPIGGRDHSPYEYLELDSIVPRTAILAGLIASIAERREDLIALRREV